jgi:betaine-aldehyde dehydrogenase
MTTETQTPPKTAPLSVPVIEHRSFIDGQWIQIEDSGRTLADPNTGEVRQPARKTAEADVERALAAAHDLHLSGQLEGLGLQERIELLRQVATSLDARVEEIALQDSITSGVPLTTTRLIAGTFGDRVRGAIKDAEDLGESVPLDGGDRPVHVLRKPLGPALIVGPWNAPTFTVSGKVAAAIAAGCPVLLKPSENSHAGTQLLAEIIAEAMAERGYPQAAFQLVHGNSSVGSLLTADPRIAALSFTGGGTAGRVVAQAAAANLAVMQMELGSNNPAIVLDDADIPATAKSIVAGMTRLNGQWCEAPGKILVDEKVHDELVEAMAAEVRTLKVGHALEEPTQVGPLAFKRHRDGLQREVDRLVGLGGELVSGAELPDLDGWFLAPGFIIGCRPEDAAEELFGPLVTVHPFTTEEEALRHANVDETGLGAFVFGADTDRALRVGGRIRAGEVRINGTFMSDLAPDSRQTFFGLSGIGGHASEYGVRFYLGDRVVGVDQTDIPL